jgi:hypothetical protein
MEMNLKLLVDTSLELFDATLYRQIIGSLMSLENTSIMASTMMEFGGKALWCLRKLRPSGPSNLWG